MQGGAREQVCQVDFTSPTSCILLRRKACAVTVLAVRTYQATQLEVLDILRVYACMLGAQVLGEAGVGGVSLRVGACGGMCVYVCV